MKPFQKRPPGTALCEDIVANFGFDSGVGYWRVTYDFLFDDDGHQLRLLNKGPVYRKSGDTVAADHQKLVSFTSTTGLTSGEGLLASDGTKLAAGARPIELTFKIRDSIDFSRLRLPDPAYL